MRNEKEMYEIMENGKRRELTPAQWKAVWQWSAKFQVTAPPGKTRRQAKKELWDALAKLHSTDYEFELVEDVS